MKYLIGTFNDFILLNDAIKITVPLIKKKDKKKILQKLNAPSHYLNNCLSVTNTYIFTKMMQKKDFPVLSFLLVH